MKKALILIILLYLNLSYAQLTIKDEYGNDLKYIDILQHKHAQKYDSIKDITYAIDLSKNETKLIGKWKDFDNFNFKTERLVGHARKYINEDNIVLEFGKFTKKWHKEIGAPTELKKMNSSSLRYHKRKKSIVLLSQFIPYLNCYIYKMSVVSDIFKGTRFTCYLLLGEKTDHVYYISCFNFDENNFENIDTFLLNIYKIN
jgi:hypothetical protein